MSLLSSSSALETYAVLLCKLSSLMDTPVHLRPLVELPLSNDLTCVGDID